MNICSLHKPVMLKEIVKYLNIKANGIYIDCTFGGGGHSKLLLNHLDDDGKLYIIDRDPSAIHKAKQLADNRITIIQDSFSNLRLHVQHYNLFNRINGIIMDLGISRDQLEDKRRGFSYKQNSPLDMRMDPINGGETVADWLNKADIAEIESVLQNYGELRYYKHIAKKIEQIKIKKRIATTNDLLNVLKKYPANQIFQAFRIKINDELNELKKVLPVIMTVLSPQGRLAILSFHSLENKIIKNFINQHTKFSKIVYLTKLPFF